MGDDETIAVYDAQADDYAKMVDGDDIHPTLLRFVEKLPPGGCVLDLGCGPGRAGAAMRDRGFGVTAIDASAEMVRLARETYDLDAQVGQFEDIGAIGVFDGIWANFSLLHMQRAGFPGFLCTLRRAVADDGVLHIAMKLGSGASRDKLGRYYAYYERDELVAFLEDAGFEAIEVVEGAGRGLAGDVEPWVAITCKASPPIEVDG